MLHDHEIVTVVITVTLRSSTRSHFPKQGWQKRSGCSDFGWTNFSQNKVPVLHKQVINKRASMIFGLVRLIVLSYDRKAYQVVQNYQLPTH